jgi:hypothetical protein
VRHLILVAVAAALALSLSSLAVSLVASAAPTFDATSATPSALAAVSCPTLHSCMAVGTQGSSTQTALAEQWDGKRWSVVPTPATGATDTTLTAVSCSSPVACTAVGYTQSGLGLAYPGTPVAERWNGTSFVLQSFPEPSGTDVGAYPSGVACPSSNRCVAVGFYDLSGAGEHSIAANWNGTSWSLQTFSGYSADLNSVSCASVRSCVGVGNFGGQTAALRWDGTTWTRMHPSNPTTPQPGDGLDAVGCTGVPAVSCQAVGDESTGDLSSSTFGLGWNGSTWSMEYTPSPGNAPSLSAVSCASANACVAVGYQQTHVGGLPLAGTWNGTTWMTSSTPLLRGSLSGVSCTAPNACTAVGLTHAHAGGLPLIERLGPSGWRRQTPA